MSIFENAPARLKLYFSDGWWEIYDGVPVVADSTLSIGDITVSVALNSQLDTRNKVWHVWHGREPVEAALAKIPADAHLDSDEVPWHALQETFERFCAIKYAKEAVVTKILHKKRPKLIPVYDRFVWEHFKAYVDSKLWSHGGAPFLIAYMQAFREELISHAPTVQDLCHYVADSGWPVTSVRLLEVLIWMEYETSGYYRKSKL